jgi:hypothetical protein
MGYLAVLDPDCLKKKAVNLASGDMLPPAQEVLRPRIGSLKRRRVPIDVGYAGQTAFLEGRGEVLDINP